MTSTRCTHATYEAITGKAWTGRTLRTGQDLLNALQNAGYTYITNCDADRPKTLRSLGNDWPDGTWYIHTSGHAMAMIDGILTDTEGRGFDMRRINGMARIVKVAA